MVTGTFGTKVPVTIFIKVPVTIFIYYLFLFLHLMPYDFIFVAALVIRTLKM